MTAQNWLSNIKNTWGQVAQVAVFVLAVLGGFLVSPPGWVTAEGNKTIIRLAHFIVTVLVGLIFLLVQTWNKKKHVRRWIFLTLGCLVGSIVAFFAYQHFLDSRTCQYAQRTVVIGTRYTPHTVAYLNDNPNSTCTTLLGDFGGQVADVWTKDSIDQARYVLAGFYILNLPLFTLCIISLVQALNCAKSKSSSLTNRPATVVNRVRHS